MVFTSQTFDIDVCTIWPHCWLARRMKYSILIMALGVLAYTSSAQTQISKQMKTIILVHGAWTDASAWDAVVPVLKAQGHEVIVVNLAGHGKDTTSFAEISLRTYVDEVKSAIGDRTDVILVGHSFAGITISQVAEEIPGQIRKLVYLAAFLPQDKESLLTLAQTDAGTHIDKYLQIDKEHGTANIAKEGIVDVFVADAPTNVQEYLVANFRAEPLAPLATPVSLTTANFGSVRKVYIHTLNDHCVSYPFQQEMVKHSNVSKEYSLPSSHTPFISMPGKLAEIILAESK
jgi:pimeloyl-ACP methyl ester carboxylesterase